MRGGGPRDTGDVVTAAAGVGGTGRWRGSWILPALLLILAQPAAGEAVRAPRRPNVLLVTIDTLRPDHLSGYGYERQTSPNLDRLMAEGVRFTQARTVVALTCPALTSMVTTLDPHEHGSTRNGLRSRAGLPSFPKILARRGYDTAAYVSNYTLRERLCGLAEHFERWEEVLFRRRLLFGGREAEADDVTDGALAWLEDHVEERAQSPFFLWVHYVEPHFPYHLQEDYLDQLGIGRLGSAFSARDRYDSEIACVDASVGRLLERTRELVDPRTTLVLFTSDHGESLGHHGYWGHGRHVYENGLRIPLSITWPGRIEPGEIGAPALLIDVAATLFGLAGFPVPELFEGFDWSPVIRGEAPEPADRITYHQGHRGTVKPTEEQIRLRRKGLLEVGRIQGSRKEVLVVRKGLRRVFDIARDRTENQSLVAIDSPPTDELADWLEEVREGLEHSDELPPPSLEERELERLEALGYLD